MLSFHVGKSQAIPSMECLLYNELCVLLNQAGKKEQEIFYTGKKHLWKEKISLGFGCCNKNLYKVCLLENV